nr:hypothetical protein [Tanacetum cinerariifolium]
MFLVYGGNSDAELQVKCYCDAGFETDRDDTKSQTGYVFTLNGGAVVWKTSKQSTTAQHAVEAEYIAAVEAAKEAVWIRKSVDELGICYCDAGFETDRDDTKSQTGYVFTLNGGAVVWKSSKQSTTAQHTAEAEYIAAAISMAKEPGIMKGPDIFKENSIMFVSVLTLAKLRWLKFIQMII